MLILIYIYIDIHEKYIYIFFFILAILCIFRCPYSTSPPLPKAMPPQALHSPNRTAAWWPSRCGRCPPPGPRPRGAPQGNRQGDIIPQ